jgi:hypothetical protein
MAFKIRRGTNAERLTITPAEGELIYTTDTKKLFIGDGSTVGGITVGDSDYVDQRIDDLIDGAGATLDTLKELADALGGDDNFAANLATTLAGKADTSSLATVATSGDYDDLTNKPTLFSGDYDDLTDKPILFSGNYNDLTNKPTIPSISGLATETYVDNAVSNLVNSAGPALDTLKELADALGNDANFATTVSTSLSNKANSADVYTKTEVDNLLWDGTSITNDLIPDTDVTYDIGSPTNRFRDIYLSSSTIYLGDKSLSIADNKLEIGGFLFGEMGNVAGVASTQYAADIVSIRVSVGTNGETIADSIIKGDKLKLSSPIGQISVLTVVSNTSEIYQANPAFKDYVIIVEQDKGAGVVNIEFDLFKPIGTPPLSDIPDPDGILPTATQAGWPEYGDLGISTLRGDQSVFIRPSWDRTPTVDFEFKEDGTLKLPAGGDIVDSAGVSVLGGGGANTADVTFSTNVVVGTGYELGLSPGSGFTGDNQYFRIRGGDNPEHLHFDTTDSTLYDLYVGDDSKYFKLSKDGPAVIQSQDQTTAITFNWTFGTDGSLSMPGDITQNSKDATVCFPNADTVIYTSTAQYRHALKLFVMVEGMTDGGGINWDTQACDIIAVRGYNNDIVSVTTYGVTYSGAQPIATFDGQWNATTSRIEITCRPTSTTNVVVSSVHAIEMNSND